MWHIVTDSKEPQDTSENEHDQNSLFRIHISQPKHVGTQKKCLYNEKLPRAPKTHVKYVKTDGNLHVCNINWPLFIQFHTRENKYINMK